MHSLATLGAAVEVVALALVPVVLLQRKEPASTVAWILALVFLPGAGAVLFLMFGRDRVRIPLRGKESADRALAEKNSPASLRHPHPPPPLLQPDEDGEGPVLRDLFHVSAALGRAVATHGNKVDLLVDGEATYAALEAAIEAAEHHVIAEYYLLRHDATAAWFRDLLARAARRGVRVKLLLDGYGSFWISRRWLRPLREAGAEVVFFLPARLILFQPMNLRNHRKIVVVDGKVAFTGGINIGDEYRGRAHPWRDAHLRIEGQAVLPLLNVVAQDWYFASRRHIADADIDRARESIPPAGSASVAIVRSGPDIQGPERETIHRVLFSAITSARESVFITTPYFIPDRSILVALQTAALRGIDVRILFPSRSNHPFVFQAGRSFYEELLAAGVAIYEYGPGMIHAKTMVVDGTAALVGSANMDIRSFRLNFEVHAVIHDPAVAERLARCFHDDLAASKRVDPWAFRARPLGWKVIEAAARLLSPLM
ncbi:MAG: cardiolipin synthase [Polyangiaceae bacterium]